MKKVILGIALLSQFVYGVEGVPEFTEVSKKGNQSLIQLNFFDNSKAEFRKKVKESAQIVASEFRRLNALPELDEEERENQKFQAVINEFEGLNIFCKDEFDKNRNKANEVFLSALAARTKDIMQKEISQKEAEIIRLQGRLDELLKDAPQTAESLKIYDRFIRRAEKNVSEAKEKTEHFDAPELVGEKQINDTFKGFSEKLNEIRSEVQEGKDNLEKTIREVFEKTQRQYEDSTNTLLKNLEYRYDDIVEGVEERYKDQKKYLAEAYDRQIAIMNDKINEFMALNAQLEKDKELLSLINSVYRSNPDDEFIRNHSFISGNVQEMKDIEDLFTRRNQVENIYNKIKLFSDLFGREDLGVKAKPSDLETIRIWLDRTNMDAVLAKYGNFSVPSNDRIHQAFNGAPFGKLEGEDGWHRNGLFFSSCKGPGGQVNSFNGLDIGKPLLDAKERLEKQIGSLNGPSKDSVQAELVSVFQNNEAADCVVRVTWTHPFRPGEGNFNSDEVNYYRNGHRLGHLFQEHIVDFWGGSDGIFGNVPLSKRIWGRWHPRDTLNWEWAWKNKSKDTFQEHLNETVNAIKNRAKLLFDFETNPNSPLQRLYQESGQTNPSVINFPFAEIDALVKQCNDFVKKTI